MEQKKETLAIGKEGYYYCLDFAGECAKAIEYRIEHDCLDAVENRLRQHGYVKERTCRMVTKTNERPGKTVFNQWFACSECEHPLNPNDKYCPQCGAKVVE